MKTNAKAIVIIKHFESLHDGDLSKIGLQPKMCPRGIWTVGWGHALTYKATDGSVRWLMGEKDKTLAYEQYLSMTADQADALLAKDLQHFEYKIDKRVKVPLTENQFGALVSFTFNLGEGNLADSTLLKRLNAGDYARAAAQFVRWNKCNGKVLRGLTLRREAEQALFMEA